MPANESTSSGMRATYQRRMLEIRGAFEAGGATGAVTIAARAAAVDELVSALWGQAVGRDPRLVWALRWLRLVDTGDGSCFLTRTLTCSFCWMGGSLRRMSRTRFGE